MKSDDDTPVNLLGEALETCGLDPITGFFRDGCCRTGPQDQGSHTVCAIVTERFLTFSASRGNDLATPRPEHGFAGLKPGDSWCLCAARWYEAWQAGYAPGVRAAATAEAATRIAPRDALMAAAIDVN